MKKLLVSLSILAFNSVSFTSPAFAASETYSIDPNHTMPVFEVSHFGLSTQRGRFTKVSGEVSLDQAAKAGKVEVNIDATSIDMGFEKWDEHMRGPDFFNTAKFPTITFKSDHLVFQGDKVVAAEGTFTMLGVSKALRLTVNHFQCAPHPMIKKPLCAADITATLKRSDWGMTKMIPAISDEIKLSIPIEAYKQ